MQLAAVLGEPAPAIVSATLAHLLGKQVIEGETGQLHGHRDNDTCPRGYHRQLILITQVGLNK